ncbi:RING finger and WD repeat domain-containing protein 3 [Chamberlinius hualienensis]
MDISMEDANGDNSVNDISSERGLALESLLNSEGPLVTISRLCDKVDVGVNTSPKNDRDRSDDDLEESMCCPICLEEWDNSSEHRVVSLKCGHLFGRSCIERWLKGNPCCPQCKTKSRRSEIRKIFGRTVRVKDTSERDRALQDLERERSHRLQLEIESQSIKYQLTQAKAEIEKLNETLLRRDTPAILANESCSQTTQALLKLTKSIKFKDGQCRVIATTINLNALAVSHISPNKLFPGFGIRKINTNYLEPCQYIHLHKDIIKDMSFHPGRQNGLLLTASTDKSLKLSCMSSSSIVHTFQTDKPVWACTWNVDNDNHLYAGLCDGSVLLYDMRQTSSHILSLPKSGPQTPVVSLQYVPAATSNTFNSGGVIVGQLNRCTFMELKAAEYDAHVFAIKGPVTSISFEPNFRHMLVTCRPNSDNPNMTHTVYELVTSGEMCTCNKIHQFNGGQVEPMLVKNLLIKNPLKPDAMLACAGDASSLSTLTWDVQTGTNLHTLKADHPTVAVNSFTSPAGNHLASLTENSVNIYNFSSS